MKTWITTAAATLAVAAALAAVPALASRHDETTLKSLEQTWLAASMQHDRVTLDALLDDRYRELSPGGMVRFKTDVLRAPRVPGGSRQSVDELHVDVEGNVAVVTGRNRFTAPNGVQVAYRFSDVFHRTGRGGDHWRALATTVAVAVDEV